MTPVHCFRQHKWSRAQTQAHCLAQIPSRDICHINYVRITPPPTGFNHYYLSSGLFWQPWNWSFRFYSCSLALNTSANGFPSPWSQFHKIMHALHSGCLLCIWSHLLLSSLFFLAIFTSLLFLNMANTVSCETQGTYHLPVTILLPSRLFAAFVICVSHSPTELESLPEEHTLKVSFPRHAQGPCSSWIIPSDIP